MSNSNVLFDINKRECKFKSVQRCRRRSYNAHSDIAAPSHFAAPATAHSIVAAFRASSAAGYYVAESARVVWPLFIADPFPPFDAQAD